MTTPTLREALEEIRGYCDLLPYPVKPVNILAKVSAALAAQPEFPKAAGYAPKGWRDEMLTDGDIILEAHPQNEDDEPLYTAAQLQQVAGQPVQWENGVGLLWDVYAFGKLLKRVVSPINSDAHAVFLALCRAGHSADIDVKLSAASSPSQPITEPQLFKLVEKHLGYKPHHRRDDVINSRTGRYHDRQRYRDLLADIQKLQGTKRKPMTTKERLDLYKRLKRDGLITGLQADQQIGSIHEAIKATEKHYNITD